MTENPYQVAVSSDKTLIHRKWKHLGTVYASSHKSAAYDIYKGPGGIISQHNDQHGIVFEFLNSTFIKVGFGTQY